VDDTATLRTADLRGASPREDVTAGIRAMAPMLVAFMPFGLLVGAAVRSSDSPLVAWLSTWTIYGGAAHLAVLDVLHDGAGVVAASLVGLVVNARLTAYAVSLAPHWRTARTRSRLAAAVVLTDATWALAHNHPTSDPAVRRRYYAGAAATLWIGWPVLVTAGTFVGPLIARLPAATLLPALTLGTLVLPQLRTRPGLGAGAAAVTTAVATASMDSGVALALAAVAGATVGAVLHRRSS
jgi:predicted branched-subunit amino acid permease